MSDQIDYTDKTLYDEVKYENGKIYKVWTLLGTEIYIGSSAETLDIRMSKHRKDYKRWKAGKYNKITVFDIFDKYGFENCKIELIEKFPCKDKPELEAREGFFQRLSRDTMVNKIIVGRTRAEYNIDNAEALRKSRHQYYTDNAEASRQYYIDNKDQIKTSKRQYRVENADRLCAASRQYYSDNADALNKKRSEKITCACGCIINHGGKARHLKSIIHQKLMESTPP
jgi:hypothetical protein